MFIHDKENWTKVPVLTNFENLMKSIFPPPENYINVYNKKKYISRASQMKNGNKKVPFTFMTINY